METSNAGKDFALRLAVFYAAVFLVLGIYLPYLPVWLAWRGLSPQEIGFITAAPLFMRVVATPLITFVADRRGDHRETILIGAGFSLVVAMVLSFAHDFWTIFVLVCLFQIANQSILPLTEAKALSGVRQFGLDYGRLRLWGSLSFIAANLIGGAALAAFAGGAVIVLVIISMVLTVAAAIALPQRRRDAGETETGVSKRIRVSDLGTLVSSPWFIVLMLASGAIQASHAVYYTFSAIHWRTLGISDGWIGALWATGVLAEVVLFAYARRALNWLGPARLVAAGAVAGGVRWTLMAFDPPFAVLFPLQALHAMTFAATFLGTLNILQSSVPESQAGTAQGLHAALAPGIIMGSVIAISGNIYQQLGAASYLVMTGLAVAGLACALALPRLVPPPHETR
jgi:MFS transporter, PPP family, 3-phenylpropionic acid transporter